MTAFHISRGSTGTRTDPERRHSAALTLMSSAHMRLSKGSDSLNFSISGSVFPVNRPPHSFLVAASGGASAATAWQAQACVVNGWWSNACILEHGQLALKRAALLHPYTAVVACNRSIGMLCCSQHTAHHVGPPTLPSSLLDLRSKRGRS